MYTIPSDNDKQVCNNSQNICLKFEFKQPFDLNKINRNVSFHSLGMSFMTRIANKENTFKISDVTKVSKLRQGVRKKETSHFDDCSISKTVIQKNPRVKFMTHQMTSNRFVFLFISFPECINKMSL